MPEYLAYLLAGFIVRGFKAAMLGPDGKARLKELRESDPHRYLIATVVLVHIWPITVASAIGALLAKPFTKTTQRRRPCLTQHRKTASNPSSRR